MFPTLRAKTDLCSNSFNKNNRNEGLKYGKKSQSRSSPLKTCQWTPDGTSLVSTSADQTMRIFTAPVDLLQGEKPKDLKEYANIKFPSAIVGSAIHSNFNLQQYDSAWIAASTSDHPIQLFNIHDHTDSSVNNLQRKVLATYPLPNPNTEIFDASLALSFPSAGALLAGTTRQRGRVALFDLNRPGEKPIRNVQLKQKCKPIVSAIAPIPADETNDAGDWSMVAAVGYYGAGSELITSLYDFRSKQVESSFNSDRKTSAASPGVTQLLWSLNGRFLYVVQRQSAEIPVLDVRMGLAQVATLSNYKGKTNQRLNACLGRSHNSGYLFTGSTDGTVCRYDDKALMGMDCDAPESWRAHASTSNVSSVTINPITENTDTLVIASAGSQSYTSETPSSENECSIKIWSL